MCRKMVSLLLAAGIAASASLTACGSGGTGPAGSSSPEPAPAANSENPASGTSGETVKLTAFVPGTGVADLETYTQIGENLKKTLPGVSLEVTQIPWAEYFTKLNVAFSGGTAPDLFGVGMGQIGPVQASGNMLELDSHLEGWDGYSDIPSNILEIASKDGKLYGNPMPEVRVLWYRKDLFEQAGLDGPPETVEELYEYAEKLTVSEGDKIKISGISIGTGEQSLFSVMLMFGAEDFWDTDLKSAMLGPHALEALDWCSKIMAEGLSDHTVMHDIQGSLFENGLAAMSFDGSTLMSQVREKLEPGSAAVAPLPTEHYQIGCTCWSVYSGTKHVEEAVALWKEIASPEGQMLIAEKVGFVPTRASLKEQYIALNPEFNGVFFDAVSKAKSYGVLNPYFFEFVNNIRPIIDEVYYGKKEAKAAMEEFHTIYDGAVAAAKAQ